MDIKKKSIQGVLWTSIGSFGGGMLSFVVTLLLARILGPYEFGILEIIIIFTSISAVIVDSGFSQALIREMNPTQKDLNSIFFLNLTLATFIYILLFFIAPKIVVFFDAEDYLLLFRFVFLIVVFDSFSVIQNAILNRQLNFKPYAQVSIIAIGLSGLIAVFLAMKGFGIWAIAVNLVSISFFRSLFLWIRTTWRPDFQFCIESVKKYYKFSFNLLIFGLVDKLVSNMEAFAIGKVYTKQALGHYSLAKTFNAYISQTTTNVVHKVSYASFSKIGSENQRLKEGYRKVIGLTMFIISPLMFFTLVTSDNLIFVLFGEKWIESAEYVRILALWGFIYPLNLIITNIFLVKGKSKLLLNLSFIRQALRIFVIIILINQGIKPMLWGIIIVSFISTLIYTYYGGALVNYKIKDVFLDLKETIAGTIISILLLVFISIHLLKFSIIVNFIIQIITMIILYSAVSKLIIKNIYYIEIKNILFDLVKISSK